MQETQRDLDRFRFFKTNEIMHFTHGHISIDRVIMTLLTRRSHNMLRNTNQTLFLFNSFCLWVTHTTMQLFRMWTQRMQRPIRLKIGRRCEEYAAIIKYLMDYFNRMSLLSTSIHYTAARLMNSSFVSYCSLYDRGVILIVII